MVFTSAPQYDPAAWQRGAERFPKGAKILVIDGARRDTLAPSLYASADPEVSFDGARVLFAGQKTAAARWQIWEIAPGGPARQVIDLDADCLRPLYVPDGRIVFTRITAAGSEIEIAEPGGKPQRLTFAPGRYLTNDALRDGRILFEADGELYTVYPDGTGVEALRCDHGPRRAGGRQIGSGEVVFSIAAGLARFTAALASQVEVAGLTAQTTGPIAEIAPGEWVTSTRAGAFYGLVRWTVADGRRSAIETPRGENAIQPAVRRPRTPPKEFPSALVESRHPGNLLCLNARDAKAALDSRAQAVQVYTRGEGGEPELLGRQELASDGSFYVEVPPDRPLRIEVVDSDGRTVRAERGWFWMRPSEQRVCVGCHLGPERAPENKVPEVLLRSIVPEKLLGIHRTAGTNQ